MANELTDWTAGAPCVAHGMGWCADCAQRAGIIVRPDGSLSYNNDCAVDTFREVTGWKYEAAANFMKNHGFSPANGIPPEGLARAFEDAGYEVAKVIVHPDDLEYISSHGHKFFITAHKGHGQSTIGHAWSVVDGHTSRAWKPPYRYQIWEVITPETKNLNLVQRIPAAK